MTNLICNKKAIVLACLLVLNMPSVFSDDSYDYEESAPEVYFYTVPQGQVIEEPKSSVKMWNNKTNVVKNNEIKDSNIVENTNSVAVVEEHPAMVQQDDDSSGFVLETRVNKKEKSDSMFKPLKFFRPETHSDSDEQPVLENKIEEAQVPIQIKTVPTKVEENSPDLVEEPVQETQIVPEVKPEPVIIEEKQLVPVEEPAKEVEMIISEPLDNSSSIVETPTLEETSKTQFNSAVDEFFESQTPQVVQITKDDSIETKDSSEIKSENLEPQEEFSAVKANEEFIKQKLKEQSLDKDASKKVVSKPVNDTRKLSGIQKKIQKEKIFKHDTVNNLYLDKYNTILDDKSKTFYQEKNIEQNEDGQLQLTTEADKPSIYELIKTIENSNPNNVFEPPVQISLRDCIGIAIAKHPSVISAQLNTEIYKSRIVQAWAAYFPSLSAGVDYSYMHSKVPDYSYGMHSAYFPNASAGLLLFDFGKTKTQADMAKVDYSASKFDLQNSINDIIYSVKSAYYNLLFAQKQVEVYERTIEQFELHLQSAQKYFSIGKKPQVDVAIAEYNVGSAKLNLVKAMNTLEVAKINLANTLGLPEFANFELCDSLEKYDYSTDLEVLLQDAFTIRPDLLSYQKMVESSLLNVRSARRGFTPDLTANSSFYRGGADPMKETNYNVSVNLSYGGMNLLQLKKELDIAKKSYEKSLTDYEQKRQSVYLEVKEAYINLNNSKETVKQSELNVDQAKAQHYHATGRYKAGLGDAIELKDSENTYMNAQLEYYQSLLDYNSDIANLERVVGRPIEVTKSKL